MRFARIVFVGAGAWGMFILVLAAAVLLGLAGPEKMPTSYPHLVYGFLAVTIAWQVAFFVVGSDPVRFRPLMIPSIVEKFGFVLTVAILFVRARITGSDAAAAVPDFVLGVLFVIAYIKTPA